MRNLPGRMPPPPSVESAAATMTSPSFTPGPWRRVGHRRITAGTGPAAVTICELFSWGDCTEADGNEALISTAPELYDAAAEVFGLIDSGFLTVGVLADDSPARVATCGRAIDALAAALGKAAGLDQAVGTEALIEAAPELYEVARDAEALLTRQKWRADPSSPEGALLLALRAVLAKVSRRAEA